MKFHLDLKIHFPQSIRIFLTYQKCLVWHLLLQFSFLYENLQNNVRVKIEKKDTPFFLNGHLTLRISFSVLYECDLRNHVRTVMRAKKP